MWSSFAEWAVWVWVLLAVDVIKVREQERGFTCSQLSQEALCASWQEILILVNLWGWSAEDWVNRNRGEVLGYCMRMQGFTAMFMVLVFVSFWRYCVEKMGCGVAIEYCFLHESVWCWSVEQVMKRV